MEPGATGVLVLVMVAATLHQSPRSTFPPFPEQEIYGDAIVSPGNQWHGYSTQPTSTSPITVLVNGSNNPSSIPGWMQMGSATSAEIATTFGGTIERFHWSDSSLVGDVIPPFYLGIVNGAKKLASVLDSLPNGPINIVAHSHGGNVAAMATWYTNRPINRLITLGTPVNEDYVLLFGSRIARPGAIRVRCQLSSWADLEQFAGASRTQIWGTAENSYAAARYWGEAAMAAFNGDFALAAYLTYLAGQHSNQALVWYLSTKVEWLPAMTRIVGGLSHEQLRDPIGWSLVPSECKN